MASTARGARASSSSRRKLFAPTPPIASTAAANSTNGVAAANGNGHAHIHADSNTINDVNAEVDAVLAAAKSASEARRSYSLRRRTAVTPTSVATTSAATTLASRTSNASTTQKRALRTSAKRTRAASASTASEADAETDSAARSDFSDSDGGAGSSDDDSDVFTSRSSAKRKLKAKSKPTATSARVTPKRTRKTSVKNEEEEDNATPKKRKSKSTSPKKPPPSPFDISPRKPVKKPLKVNLDPSEAHPAPAHWETVYGLLSRQRAKIVAPVDTMGCEENGRSDRRADSWRATESPQDSAKRERLATLVSLMLSSQTKDPVTAEAVYNLQRSLPDGLCLKSLLEADDETISSCIAKVGFWRRKTGYLKSAARILADDFQGDVPRTVDELCSLPGVGPKMAFLALSSMGIQLGIGVDTHVHRMTNRLGWHKTNTPEQTRLNLQSWLPHDLHPKINRLLVGFGQVICVPVGPRCDLCDVGKSGLCPSKRDIDQKSLSKRVKVDLLPSDDQPTLEDNRVKVKRQLGAIGDGTAEAKIKVEMETDAPLGNASMEVRDLLQTGNGLVMVKKEQEEVQDAAAVERVLDW